MRKAWYIKAIVDKNCFYCCRPDTRSDTFKKTKRKPAWETSPHSKRSDLETHEYNIYSEDEFTRFLSVIENKRAASAS